MYLSPSQPKMWKNAVYTEIGHRSCKHVAVEPIQQSTMARDQTARILVHPRRFLQVVSYSSNAYLHASFSLQNGLDQIPEKTGNKDQRLQPQPIGAGGRERVDTYADNTRKEGRSRPSGDFPSSKGNKDTGKESSQCPLDRFLRTNACQLRPTQRFPDKVGTGVRKANTGRSDERRYQTHGPVAQSTQQHLDHSHSFALQENERHSLASSWRKRNVLRAPSSFAVLPKKKARNLRNIHPHKDRLSISPQ